MTQWFMQFAETPKNVESKAARLGLLIGFIAPVMKSDWSDACAVAGNTFAVKDTLKANGARWNGVAKAWMFASQKQMSTAINAIAEVN